MIEFEARMDKLVTEKRPHRTLCVSLPSLPSPNQVFELVRAQEWYTAEESTCIRLLSIVAKMMQPKAASRLFDSLLQDKLRPTTPALLTVYTESKYVKMEKTWFPMPYERFRMLC